MSGLVYKGDTIDNFGEYLPCPYIEKIYVEETGWVVQISLMINTFSKNPDVELIENNLSALTYYVCPIWDQASQDILDNHRNDDIFRLLPSFQKWDQPMPIQDSLHNDVVQYTPRTFRFQDFQKLPGPFLDDSGNQILKYTVPYDESAVLPDPPYTGVPARSAGAPGSSGAGDYTWMRSAHGMTMGADDSYASGAGMGHGNDQSEVNTIQINSLKFGPFASAIPFYDSSLKDQGYRFDRLRLIAWSSPINIPPAALRYPDFYDRTDDSSLAAQITYRKYNPDTDIIDETPVNRSKPAHYVQFPTRCGFSPQMVQGDLRVPVGASLIDLYETGNIAETDYAKSDFFAARGTSIDTQGDVSGHIDYSGTAIEFSSRLLRTNIKQIYAFNEDSVLGYLPFDADLYAQGRVAGETHTYGESSDRDIGEKCVEYFSDLYADISPIYSYDPDNYDDHKLYKITVGTDGEYPTLGSPSTKADRVAWSPAIIKEAYTFNDLDPILINQYVSDIAVEDVYQNGNIVTAEHEVYVRQDESICSQQPIQALDGNLYAPDEVKLVDIVENFKKLLDSYEIAAEKDRDLAEIIAETSLVLIKYGEDVSFLPRMNKLRHAWPDKSTATKVGRLYERIKRRIYNANVAVRNQGEDSRLYRKFVANNKVVRSIRGIGEVGYLKRFTGEGQTGFFTPNVYIPNETSRVNESSPEVLITRQYVEGAGSVENFIRASGYWFFDYEQAIRNESAIAQIFNLDKLYLYFGRQLVNAKFKFKNVRMDRRWITDTFLSSDILTTQAQRNSSDVLKRFSLNFDVNAGIETPTVKGLTQVTNEDYTDAGFETVRIMKRASADSTPFEAHDKSYLMLRALGGLTPGPGGVSVDNYRLAAFEFQDYYDLNGEFAVRDSDPLSEDINFSEPREFYRVQVIINDETMKVYNSIKYHFATVKNEVWDYLQLARENCSYNNYEFRFNEFFSQAMASQYEGVEASAPWIRGPLLYEIHRDILGSAHLGDVDKLKLTAKQTADNINPFSGNLPDLEQFWLSIWNMWNLMYDAPNYAGNTDPGSGGSTGSVFDRDDDPELEAGGFATSGNYPKDLQEDYGRDRNLVFQTDISDLPRIVNFPDSAIGTSIDDLVGWVRMDLARYFELIYGHDASGDEAADMSGVSMDGGVALPGVSWREDGTTFGPTTSSDVVWNYLRSLTGGGPNEYYYLIKNADTSDSLAEMSTGYSNFCLGDLWVLAVVALAELNIQVEDAVNLIVYDTPSVAQVEAFRTVGEGYGYDDGYIRDSDGSVTGLAPAGSWSYRSSELADALGGILDRASDGGAAVETAFSSRRNRGEALAALVKAFNMSNRYMPNDNYDYTSVQSRQREAGLTIGTEASFPVDEALRTIRRANYGAITYERVNPAEATEGGVLIESEGGGGGSAGRGYNYEIKAQNWWNYQSKVDDYVADGKLEQAQALSKLAGRSNVQVRIYAEAVRHIYENYSFGGVGTGTGDTESRNRLLITGTRGGTEQTAINMGLDPATFRGMNGLVYATNVSAGASSDTAYDDAGAATGSDVLYSGMEQFSGYELSDLINLTGGDYYETS